MFLSILLNLRWIRSELRPDAVMSIRLGSVWDIHDTFKVMRSCRLAHG